MRSNAAVSETRWESRAAVLLVAAATLGLAGPTAAPSPRQDPIPNPAPPQSAESLPDRVVVVELFTSQGCSSCPPADRLLAKVAEESAGRVVTLSFHVDSWNSIGWTDPFSKKEWTQRQVAYGRTLGLTQTYTPQAVVDGGAEFVGSNADRLRAAIDAAAARPGGQISLQLEPEGSRVRVGAEVTLPEALRGQSLDLMLAVFETGLVTPVGRGENSGRTLRNDYVVRRLERGGRLAANGPPQSRHTASLRLSKDWEKSRLGVAAFLQDPKSLAIRGAAAQAIVFRTEN